jgi:hypothetical protein
LSQRRNYLFIAYVDQIHVFKPQLPAQVIPCKPELVLNLPKTRRGLRGYIDPRHPHAVNQLIVAELGIQEVLVAACDDGDVIAYSVWSIHNAIRENYEREGLGLPELTELKAMLLTNVGTSAWGLAVHKEARLIAVSSNHHQISVFAFSLHQENASDDLLDEDVPLADILEDVFWKREDQEPCSPHDRSQNVEIVLEGHMNNIPNIAFCNADMDPLGTFLASIDISGSTFIWNVWQRKVVASFRVASDGPRASQLSCKTPFLLYPLR